MTKVGESSPVLINNNTGIIKKANNSVLPTTPTPDIPSYNKNSGVALKSNYDDSDFDPQNPNLVFKPGADLIYSDNLDVKIVDNNGIDTNSKGDLDVKLKGQVVFSKKFLDQSIGQLRQQLKSQSDYLDLAVNYDSNKNQYTLKLICDNPVCNFEIADVALTFGDNGINVAYNLGTVPSIAAGLIPGLSAVLPVANQKFREWAKDELSNKLGLTVKGDASYFENSFTLVPELQKNQLLKSIPVANMNVNLEGVVSNGINFRVQPNGDIAMNLDATVKGSSGTEQKPAEAIPDTLKAKVDLAYRDNGNVDIAVNAKLKLDVEEREKGELREQFKGFGIDATATGHISVDNISSTTTIVNGKAINTSGKSTATIKAKELNIEAGSTKVHLNSAQGNLGFQQTEKGYSLDLGAGSVSGNVSGNNFSASFNNLKASGTVNYTPGNYNIQGAHISADGINVNNTVKVKSLDVSGANVNINTTDGAFSVSANKSTRATVKNLSIGTDLNLSGSLSGSVDYNNQGITINGGTSNLRGKIGNFVLDDLDAKGKVNLDKSGNLNLADVTRFNLATDGLSIKGSQLVIAKNNDTITITDNKSDDKAVKKGHKKPDDISGNLTIISPANKAAKTPEKVIASNLKFEGSIQYNTATKTLNFNNPNDPLNIKSGSIADVKFNNFKPKGELLIGDDNSVTLKAPASFGGSASYQGVTIGNVSFKANEGEQNGDISFNATNKSVSLNGSVDLDLSLPGKTSKDKSTPTKLSMSGNIELKPQTIGEGKDKREVITLSSKDGTITGKFGNVSLKDFKFNGQVIYDQKTGDVSLKRFDEQTPLSIKGQLNGADLDLTSTDGTVVLHDPKKNNGNYVVDTGNFQVKGSIAGIDFETKDTGITGKITITPDGKPTIEGLDYSVKVGDIELKGKGSAGKTADGGYEIDLSGKIVTDSGKINELLDKVATTPFAKGHEDKLKDLQNVLKQVDLTKIKYDDLKISFDKDFNYTISGVATDMDLNISDIPERNISIQNQAPGKISFQMDNQGKMSLSTEGTNINATINGTKFKDFKINGSVNYAPQKGNEPGKITFAGPKKEGESQAKGMEIAGDIIFENKGNPLTRKLNLKADADINLVRNGNDLEFTGDNIQLDGMFSDFKVKSIPSGNPPTFANGKFTIKDDGHIDISKLNFNLDVEGIQLSNKDGAFSSTAIDPNNLAKRDYQIKLAGNVNTDIGKFMQFLDKVGNDQITPKSARDSINNTLVSLNKFFKEGNIDGKYNLTMDLDESFGLKSFKNETNATINNAKLKLDAIGSPYTLNFDKLNISAVSEIPRATTPGASNSLYIKEGKVDFELTTGLKDSISNAAKNMLTKAIVDNSGGKVKTEDVNLQVDVQPDGGMTVNGSIKGIPIVDKVKIGGGVSIEGTTVNVSVDKVKLAGLLGGIVQFVARPFTGDLKERVTDEVVNGAAANGFAIDYSGKNKFSIDLQGVLNQYVNDSVKLSDVKIENNHVTVKYEATYGADKSYDMQKITDTADLLRKTVASKDKKEIVALSASVLPKLSSLTPQEMSMSLDRVGFTDELFKRLGKDKTCELMKKLLANQDKDRNLEHLTRLVKTVSKSNNSKEGIKALSEFIKFINESKKAGNPIPMSAELINTLNNKVKELK